MRSGGLLHPVRSARPYNAADNNGIPTEEGILEELFDRGLRLRGSLRTRGVRVRQFKQQQWRQQWLVGLQERDDLLQPAPAGPLARELGGREQRRQARAQ